MVINIGNSLLVFVKVLTLVHFLSFINVLLTSSCPALAYMDDLNIYCQIADSDDVETSADKY